jgi:hypothetical protein
MLILSERHLRHIVTEYAIYFNEAHPHQGIGQPNPCDPPLPDLHPIFVKAIGPIEVGLFGRHRNGSPFD